MTSGWVRVRKDAAMILQAVILHLTLIGRAALARRGKRGPHTFVSWQEEVWRGPVTVCVCVCVRQCVDCPGDKIEQYRVQYELKKRMWLSKGARRKAGRAEAGQGAGTNNFVAVLCVLVYLLCLDTFLSLPPSLW